MEWLHVLMYCGSFFFIWYGSGLIVSSLDRFSKKLHLSSFAVSFVILGLLTSIPELAVGLTAVNESKPEVFVGNLLGGILVIFLCIIPVLAIMGNGIQLKHEFDGRTLPFILAVIAVPSLFILDKRVTNWEGVLFILLYVVCVIIIERRHGFFDHQHTNILDMKAYSCRDIIKMLTGLIIVFVTSRIIVNETVYFSDFFHISPFYVSLILLSLGTNLPELSLAIRSVRLGKKDVALGDYMGSAAANTVLFGIFTLLINGEVLTVRNFFTTFIFMMLALTLFYVFTVKGKISRANGWVLLALYVIFVWYELLGK